MEFYILIFGLILLILYIFIVFNKLVKLRNRVNEAFSVMDVYLKERWDLVPNIVEVVKGYSKHEKNTLEEVIKLRRKSYDDLDVASKLDMNHVLTNDIGRLMLLAEAYPELKASEQFLGLSKELTRLEDCIAQSRKYYNACIRLFNNKVEMFPSNIVAKIFRFKSYNMFEIKDEERENVEITL